MKVILLFGLFIQAICGLPVGSTSDRRVSDTGRQLSLLQPLALPLVHVPSRTNLPQLSLAQLVLHNPDSRQTIISSGQTQAVVFDKQPESLQQLLLPGQYVVLLPPDSLYRQESHFPWIFRPENLPQVPTIPTPPSVPTIPAIPAVPTVPSVPSLPSKSETV